MLRAIQACVAANGSEIGGYATFDSVACTEPLAEDKAPGQKPRGEKIRGSSWLLG